MAAVLLLKIPQVKNGFFLINRAVDAVSAASRAGTSFVFGYLGGGALPFAVTTPGAEFVLAPHQYRARDGVPFNAEGYAILVGRMIPQVDMLLRRANAR